MQTRRRCQLGKGAIMHKFLTVDWRRFMWYKDMRGTAVNNMICLVGTSLKEREDDKCLRWITNAKQIILHSDNLLYCH